jgi:hypothetical protein
MTESKLALFLNLIVSKAFMSPTKTKVLVDLVRQYIPDENNLFEYERVAIEAGLIEVIAEHNIEFYQLKNIHKITEIIKKNTI